MTPGSRLAVLLALPALGLGACGGDDGGGSSGGGLPKDPAAAVKAAGDALAEVPGFRLEGSAIDPTGTTKLAVDVRADGSFDAVIDHDGALELRAVDGVGYLKAPAAFWQANGGAKAAAALAGKWVKGSAEQFGAAEVRQFLPKNLAFCLGQDVGTLSDGGTGDVGGTAVRIIKSAGDKPGSSVGELSIATEGEPYPVRVTQSGPNKPGGNDDPRCGSNEDGATTQRSDVTLSDFGAAKQIEVPAGALDLTTIAQGLG